MHWGHATSRDLQHWTLECSFGAGLGAHGGVWECPDLFPLIAPDGTRHWVLLVSLNSGGPNEGSATQYFLGGFDGWRLTLAPAREWQALRGTAPPTTSVQVTGVLDLSAALAGHDGSFVLDLVAEHLSSFALALTNAAADTRCVGYDAMAQRLWIDRRLVGDLAFHPAFAAQHSAPCWMAGDTGDLSLWFDRTSVELFADHGLTTMTSLHFSRAP